MRSKSVTKNRGDNFLGKYAVVVGLLILAIGAICLILAQPPSNIDWKQILEEFGIALCSTGLISVAYEILIRDQLLAEHESRIREILSPDTGRLGVVRIFGSRSDRANAGYSVDSLIEKTKRDFLFFTVAPTHLLAERQHLLIDLVKRGGTVRLLLASPAGRNVHALDDTLSAASGLLLGEIAASARAIQRLYERLAGKDLAGRLIVRYYDFVPPFAAIASDIDSADATFVVELNGLQRGDNDRPAFELARRGEGLFEHYSKQLEEIWQVATPYDTVPRTSSAPLIEHGISVGWQKELYTRARSMCNEMNIRSATYYHYSGSLVQGEISELLQDGGAVCLYLQDPAVAMALNAQDQVVRISGMVDQFRSNPAYRSPNLTLRSSIVPNSVRGANFGDRIIVLGWYLYEAKSSRPADRGLPEVYIKGNESFGILIESSNAAFAKAKRFLESYEAGLSAQDVAF